MKLMQGWKAMQYEAINQEAVVKYCEYRNIPIFAIPNGGKRNKKEAYYLKKAGLKPGVPDLCVPVAKKGYFGLYIEMKHGNNKPTDNQKAWIELLNNNGYLAKVCVGAKEAMDLLNWYFAKE